MKRKIKLLIFILFIFITTGCYSYKEINESAIVSGIAIDKGDTFKYKVSVQIMNAKKKDEESTSLITYYSSQGNTVYEAMQKMLLDAPKDLYEGHNEILLISEELAKEETPLNFLDYFMRENAVEKNALVMIAKGNNAGDILKIITPLETLPSENLRTSLLLSSDKIGRTNLITIDDFVSKLLKDGIEVYAPSIKLVGSVKEGKSKQNIEDSNPDTKVVYDTIAIFKNKKFYEYLSKDEAFALNILNDKAKASSVTFKCDNDNYASINISGVSVNKRENYKNKMNVDLNVKIIFEIKSYDCKINLIRNSDNVKAIENKASKKIKSTINKLINHAYYNGKSDILGIGNDYYKMHYLKYKSKKLFFSKIVNNIKFKIKVKAVLDSPEFIIKSVKEEE